MRSALEGQARRVRIVMPDDRLVGMNDVLLVDGGWYVLQHQPASP